MATTDIDLGWMQIPKGTVVGQNGVWTGTYHGRPLIEVGLAWWLSDQMEPDFTTGGHGHVIEVIGTPSFRVESEIVRPPDADRVARPPPRPPTPHNAIGAVVAARPGLVTLADLPTITTRTVKP